MKQPFFTIGHSTRTIEEFVELLRAGKVAMVIDIRTVPRSRTNPQYNLDILPDLLAPYQIAHGRLEALGGLRKRSDVAPEVNGFWENRSFHNYADHALSPEFQEGLQQLLSLGSERRVAVMCSEAVWWRCHRRFVADYLLARGETVFHLMAKGKVEPARLNPAAVRRGSSLVYPAPEGEAEA